MLKFLKENRRQVIIASLFLVVLLGIIGLFFYFYKTKKEAIQREYKIALITDIHSTSSKNDKFDIDDSVKSFFDYIIPHFNDQFHPDVLVENGDFIEGTNRKGQKSIEDFQKLNKYFNQIKTPGLHVFGNHESRGLSKQEWLDLVGYEKPYYHFDLDDMRIIVLDGNEENAEEEELEKPGENFYYMSEDQINWLENTLKESENFKHKIVFIHFPVSEVQIEISDKNIDPKSRKALNSLFEKFDVDAVFSGHTERLQYNEFGNVRYFILPGIEKSKRKKILWLDCFYEIYTGEKTSVKMYYKKDRDNPEYQTLIIPSPEFDAIEK